jgi:electron transfer flavoprotein beta subunit
MKAKKKTLDILELEQMGLSLKKHIEVLKVAAPAVRSAGVKVESVIELLNKLQHEAKVL